ncbi:Transcription factor [Pleurostoma richardsiae]|uniref:Transcription factor n=1 Tax=Pleurostoma richardsiae TaxID=41990 RepID=A0AA38REW4_9PEZI|nr:Transcription factor [Pleurostoma richardsiae]
MQHPESTGQGLDVGFQCRHLESISPPGESPSQGPLASMSSRVCDNCICKKVKCDRGRPTCSRCLTRGETCTYTSIRRKPGPQRGSQHAELLPNSQRSSESSATSGRSVSQEPALEPSIETRGGSPQLRAQLHVSQQQEEYLIEKFFDIVQDANPILSRERFLYRYRNSLCCQDLVSTIVTITAKLTGFSTSTDGSGIDARIDFLLSSSLLEQDMIGDSPSLDQYRKACLLAFYEFHQFPGHQSWMRIGRLTRMAYRIGLDRLENLRKLYREWSVISKEDIQEWRSVWWCIYRLDTYSNISSGTPFLIESDLINTSLVMAHSSPSPGGTEAPQELYLPSESEGLWKLLSALTSDPETMIMNIHNLTVAATREAGSVTRSHLLRPQEDTIKRLGDVGRHLSALRLALPHGWLNPKRNAFSYESQADHHARLLTILHLLMAQLLLSISDCDRKQYDEWLMSWQRVLEICQDIASIAEQWNSSFCLKVDPGICFIIFTALIFLDVHQKSPELPANQQANIIHDKTVLRLQLEQFARIWTLPKLLTLSFETFSESVSGPLSYRQVSIMLSRFEAPLHPRWLQFLSSARVELESC